MGTGGGVTLAGDTGTVEFARAAGRRKREATRAVGSAIAEGCLATGVTGADYSNRACVGGGKAECRPCPAQRVVSCSRGAEGRRRC